MAQVGRGLCLLLLLLGALLQQAGDNSPPPRLVLEDIATGMVFDKGRHRFIEIEAP